MIKILTKEMMEEAYSKAITTYTTEEKLAERAGNVLFSVHSYLGRTLIIIGEGTSAAYGLALAKILKIEKKDVFILQIFDLSNPLLLSLLTDCLILKIPIYKYNEEFNFLGYDTFVDGILGIDFNGDMEEPVKTIIEKINNLTTFTISIDINSGINPNNGKVNLAIKADKTIALGYHKVGHFLNDAKDYIRELKYANIGITYNKECYLFYTESDCKNVFKKRNNNSHKGTYGYIGIMGGSYKYSGSMKLANLSLAALNVGCGVTRIITTYCIADALLPYILESTLFPLSSNKDGNFIFIEHEVKSAIKGLKALAFGMGMGENPENEKILDLLLREYEGKLLIDADGINALSKMDLSLLNKAKCEIVLTPHTKEFSRLIKVPIDEILNNPVYYVKEFTLKYNCILLLKGPSTIVSICGKIYIVPSGTMALAKGGSGDILSGIIAGIMGYSNALDAALAGAYVLGFAGEIAYSRIGAYSTLPRDTINIIKGIMKKY